MLGEGGGTVQAKGNFEVARPGCNFTFILCFVVSTILSINALKAKAKLEYSLVDSQV